MIMISRKNPLILASGSPRRKDLLSSLCLPFRIVKSEVEENCSIGDPEQMTLMLSEKKSLDVFSQVRHSWIIGADTVVFLDGNILGKPATREEAIHMLSLLSGREHLVVTGFSLVNPDGSVVHSEAVRTKVCIKKLERADIEGYVDTGEPFDKAGAYAIQGIGSFMVTGIKGSYTNVVGLPVPEVVDALISAGALERFPLPL